MHRSLPGRAQAAALAVLAPAVLALAAACEPATAELAAVETARPPFASAADFAAVTVDAPGLCLTGAARVEFARVGDTFGFAFGARAGDTFTAGTGGEPGLDTVLSLFGPADGEGWYGEHPVALDDDGGDGLLSRISSYPLEESGRFLLVVTTWGGQGRGVVTLRVALNGADGCAAEPEPEPVCCLVPAAEGEAGRAVTTTRAECRALGGQEAPAARCAEPPPDPVCCLLVDAGGLPRGAPLERAACLDRGGRPAPVEACATRSCCAVRTADGTPVALAAVRDACLAAGGVEVPGGLCDAPRPEPVCCLLPGRDGRPLPQLVTDLACFLGNGTVASPEVCAPPPPACCALPGADGQRELVALDEESCRLAGGAPLDPARCEGLPPAPVCCELVDPGSGASFALLLAEDRCLLRGGVPVPPDACRDPDPEQVCCVLVAPDGQQRQWRVTLAEDCLTAGGAPDPVAVCLDAPSPGCCRYLDEPSRQQVAVWADEAACRDRGGQFEPDALECSATDPSPVCCAWIVDGAVVGAWVADEATCVTRRGQPAAEEWCATAP